ncbi:MAG TPA: Holliday junction resolvase RecU [Blastocatellia bacterium]|jgi:recombination protein U|nr:Holliday junction resolvase RecU [Blastocatellia bacterium]
MNLKRRGAETGSGFQETVNRINEAYERAGRAYITRKAIPGKYLIRRGESRRGLSLPPIDFASSDAQPRLSYAELIRLREGQKASDWRRFVPESKAEPDYGGVVAAEGRAIFYDAKTTRRNLLDFDNLHAHQITFLERAARFGAMAGFLVEFSACAEVYFLPIQIVTRWREEIARKSFPYRFFPDNLTPAPQGKGLIIYDYLKAVEEQERLYGRGYERFILTVPRAWSRRKAAADEENG